MGKNVFGKIALVTLGLVIAVAVVVFALLSLACPGVMAGWCERSGNYSFALRYASLHYSYTGGVEQAARCAQDSILAESDKNVVKYGTQLVDHDGFDTYCAEQDEYYSTEYGVSYSYRQYIYGEVAAACYSRGDTQSAIGFAIEAADPGYDRSSYVCGDSDGYEITGFSSDSAIITLSLEVIDKSDGGAAGYIVTVLKSITAEGDELANLQSFTEIMEKVADGTYTA